MWERYRGAEVDRGETVRGRWEMMWERQSGNAVEQAEKNNVGEAETI